MILDLKINSPEEIATSTDYREFFLRSLRSLGVMKHKI